jgi:hypothetical protein
VFTEVGVFNHLHALDLIYLKVSDEKIGAASKMAADIAFKSQITFQ